MRARVPEAILASAWRAPGARILGPRAPVVLLYHGVPRSPHAGLSAASFEAHVRFLTRHFDAVAADELGVLRNRSQRLRVALTFDDGFGNNADVVAPILQKYRVPALFFISSRHSVAGKYLWFSYLRALERNYPGERLRFRDNSFDMTPRARSDSMQRLSAILLNLRPHPTAMYSAIETELPPLEEFVAESELQDCYAGMTRDQVAQLAAEPLFSVGAHTVDHPFLSRCDAAERLRQIQSNREWLEAVCGQPCETIAYPSGDYDTATLDACRAAGFISGYAVASREDPSSPMEIPRIGIYSSSTEALGFKMQWGSALRACGLAIG